MTALALTVLTASLLGSLHCAGMCGGLVAFAAGDAPGQRASVRVHLAHGLGRLLAYVALGAAAGALGAAVDLAGSVAGFQRAAAVVAGTLIVAWGSATLLGALGFRRLAAGWSVPRAPRLVTSVLARALRRLTYQPAEVRALVIGLLAGCLPCGWLWAFVVTAAGTGGAPTGALVMAAFWAGTMPVMLSLGLGLAVLAAPLRRHLPAACAVAMIVVGLLAVAGRVGVVAGARHRNAPVADGDTVRVVPHAHH